MMGLSRVPVYHNQSTGHRDDIVDDTTKEGSTFPGGIQGPHVENVNALHLSDELQTLQTGGLADVGRDGAGLGTGGDQVVLVLDLCAEGVS